MLIIPASPTLAGPQKGTSPMLTVRELDGKEFDLRRLRGEVVIVHFWATWCPQCRSEMEILDTFYRHTPPGHVTILALNTEAPKMRRKVETIAQPLAYEVAMQSDIAASDFEIPRILPVTYVIDRNGVLQYAFSGEKTITKQSLEAIVNPLLK